MLVDALPEEVVVEGAKTVEAMIVVRTVCPVVNVETAPTKLLMLLELPAPSGLLVVPCLLNS